MRRIVMRAAVFTVVCTVGLAGWAASGGSSDTRAFRPEEIRAAEREMVAALESSDPTAWVFLYTEDAVFLESSGRPVVGRQALLEMARKMKPLSSVTISAERTVGHGDLAAVYGRASWVNGRPPDTGSTSRMRGVMIWRKEADGRWRMAQEVLVPDAEGG